MYLNHDNTKLTVELRDVVESGVDVWDFDYPSYYEGDQKKAFEKKVLDHYWFRQIGQETVGRFLHYFRSRINDIMPYYVQLYESVDLMTNAGDPFEAYNLTETMKRKTSTDNVQKFSNTPEGRIDDLDNYLTEARKDDGGSEEEYELTRRGNIGVQTLGQEIQYYRSALINVDLMIIDELKDLFLMVY